MPFANPLASTPAAAPAQEQRTPPAFRAWADSQIGQMSGGTAKSWDDLDTAFATLPVEPGKERKDTAAQVKRDLLKTYTDSVLPQYYQDPKALNAAKAYAESAMAPHIMASAFKPLVAAGAGSATDKNAAQQDKFNELVERRENAAESAKAAIHLDKLKRLNGQKYIKELGLNDMDEDLAVEFIKTERDKRVAKSLEVEQEYASGQLDYETAQKTLDQLYRENQNLEGAEFSIKDNAGWMESGAYAVGGIAKGLIAIPELLARTYSGSVSGLNGDGFGTGWQDDASLGGYLGSVSKDVSDWQHEISRYDPSAVAQQYVMQAFDQGGMSAGLETLRANPEAAWEMIATSGVDSIATFFTGGTAVKGARIAGNVIVDGGKALPQMMQAAPSLAAMKDIMVGATKAASVSRGAHKAFVAGAITVPAVSAGLTDARESAEYMRTQLDAMPDDKFLALSDVQVESAVWMRMDAARQAEYIKHKKADLVGQMMAEQTAVISAGLMATGYVGSKIGLDKFLIGSQAGAATATATVAKGSALKAAGVHGVVGGLIESAEEAGETGTQHLFVNSYLDRDYDAETPFDNFSGAAVSGFIVGGPIDAAGGYMQSNRETKQAADLTKAQDANAAFAARSGQLKEADLKAAADTRAARNAATTAYVMSQIAAENAERAKYDNQPETWAGGHFIDENGNLIGVGAKRFTVQELEDPEVQMRIDNAFTEFNKEDDPYSAMAILTSPDGMGLTGKQKRDLETTYNIATDPNEKDKALQYQAKIDLLATTNIIRLSELGKDKRTIIEKALGARRADMAPTSPNQIAGLLPAPAQQQKSGLPIPHPTLGGEPIDGVTYSEVLPADDLADNNVIYGAKPDFDTEVVDVLGLPKPPRDMVPVGEPISQPPPRTPARDQWDMANQLESSIDANNNPPFVYSEVVDDAVGTSTPFTPGTVYARPDFEDFDALDDRRLLPAPPRAPADTRGADGLRGFPVDQFGARDGQQLAVAATQQLSDVDAGQRRQFFDDLDDAFQAYRDRQPQIEAEQQAAEQAKQLTPMPSESRTAIALAAGIPQGRATVTVAAETNEDSSVGVQVVAYDDGSMGVVMSGSVDGDVRIHEVEIASVVHAATKVMGNNDPLGATQLALTAVMNRVRQSGLKGKNLVPAVRFAVATAAMGKVDGKVLNGKTKKDRMAQAAGLLFLQRTIEEDRARIIDGSGRTALEYVTGVRDVLPAKHKAHAKVLSEARIKWHETDNLLRETGFYNKLDAAGHQAGVGKPTPKAEVPTIEAAAVIDANQTAALAANDAANDIANGGTISAEQAAEIVDSAPELAASLAATDVTLDVDAFDAATVILASPDGIDPGTLEQAAATAMATRNQVRAVFYSGDLAKHDDSPEETAALEARTNLSNTRYGKGSKKPAWSELQDQPPGAVARVKGAITAIVEAMNNVLAKDPRVAEVPPDLYAKDPVAWFSRQEISEIGPKQVADVVKKMPKEQAKEFARLLGIMVGGDVRKRLTAALSFAASNGVFRGAFTPSGLVTFLSTYKADGTFTGVRDKDMVNKLYASIAEFSKTKKSATYFEKVEAIVDATVNVRRAMGGLFPNRATWSGSEYAMKMRELTHAWETQIEIDHSKNKELKRARRAALEAETGYSIEDMPLSGTAYSTAYALMKSKNPTEVSLGKDLAAAQHMKLGDLLRNAGLNAKGIAYAALNTEEATIIPGVPDTGARAEPEALTEREALAEWEALAGREAAPVVTTAVEPTPPDITESYVTAAQAKYDADPRSAMWDAIREREAELTRAGKPVQDRTDSEWDAVDYAMAESMRIAKMRFKLYSKQGNELESEVAAPVTVLASNSKQKSVALSDGRTVYLVRTSADGLGNYWTVDTEKSPEYRTDRERSDVVGWTFADAVAQLPNKLSNFTYKPAPTEFNYDEVTDAANSYIKSRRSSWSASIFDDTNAIDLVRSVQAEGFANAVRPYVDQGTAALAVAAEAFVLETAQFDVPVRSTVQDRNAPPSQGLTREPYGPESMTALGMFRTNSSENKHDILLADRTRDAFGITQPIASTSAAYTAVHELLHAASVSAYKFGESWHKAVVAGTVDTQGMSKAAQDAMAFYHEVNNAYRDTMVALVQRGSKRDDIDNMYGMTNPYEFIAELSSPKFRAMLNTIPSKRKRTSILGEMARRLAKMLGVTEGTVLDDITTSITGLWQRMEDGGTPARELLQGSQVAFRAAVASKMGIGSSEFDAFVEATLEDQPISGTMLETINDPMDGC